VDTGPCGWWIGQWDANPASQRRTCRLGFTATPSVPVGGNTYSSLTNLKPPSLPSSGRLVIVPPHSACSQRVAFPRNIWGAPASCRQISVKNWQWGTRFSSGKMGAPSSPGSTEELPPPPTPSSVPPSLHLISIAVHGDTLHGTHPTALISRRPSTAPQATWSPKVV